ncbi:MAG: PEGA domain-containing protein [Deltaproteobacteria bacterium]|nr:PEGA domain-containing protein [Deltaproteobacteria bacterium]
MLARLALCVVCALALAAPGVASADESLGIVAFETGRAEPAAADSAQRAALEVASRTLSGRPARIIEGAVAQARGCRDATCLGALGRTHGDAYVLVLGVGRTSAGAPYVVSARLVVVDVGAGASSDVGMAQIEVPPGTTDWPAAMGSSLESLLHQVPAPPAPVGSLLVTANVAGAEVFLDGNRLGSTPLEAVPNVAVGRHQLRVRSDRHADYLVDVDVVGGVEARVDAELEPMAPPPPPPDTRPFYRRPWVWGVAGAVVVTGVIVAVVVATSGESTGGAAGDAVPIPAIE